MTAYLLYTDYLFVKAKDANPIGIGVLQWLLVMCHLLVTAIVLVIRIVNSKEKRQLKKTLWVSLLAIVFWVLFNILVSSPVWNYLWNLRGQ